MTRIYLLRHGSAYNENGEQNPQSSLNEGGVIQAQRLAERLKDTDIYKAYSSPYKRALETANFFYRESGIKPVILPGLSEIGSGDWPSPETCCDPDRLKDFYKSRDFVEDIFLKIVGENKGKPVALFTHGNWIRMLLSAILKTGPESFVHFIISLASVTIIDIDDNGFISIITVSDGYHHFCFK